MQRRNLRYPRSAINLADEGCDGAGRRDVGRCLTQVGDRLQGAVTDLEDLMFESPDAGGRCRAELHDAVGLVMEALQALARARSALERRGEARGGLSVHSMAPPLARA